MGSISDIEQTKVSDYLQTFDGEGGVSVMARTIGDILSKKGVSLNILTSLAEPG